MKLLEATNETGIQLCWNVMKVLRPHLKESEFVPMIMEMISAGYHLAYIEEDGMAMSAIGYRFQQFLYSGRHCYIDDLVTLPNKTGKGYAGMLIDYVTGVCKQKGLQTITLDSAFSRLDAHRLYLNKRFDIIALHFSKTIQP